MRKTWLTLTLVAMIALPVLAQRGGFGFGGNMFAGDGLLMFPDVQKELKLTDEQKKELGTITKSAQEYRTKSRDARQDGDQEKAKEYGDKANDLQAKGLKKLKESLTSEQTKRLHEIEVNVARQFNSPNIFKNTAVVKALKLTPKQEVTVKETLSDLAKDTKEVQDEAKGAKGDKGAFFKTMQKVQSLNKEAYEKITKSLNDDQQKTLKELGGKEFKLEFGKGGFGKGKKNKKKDDF